MDVEVNVLEILDYIGQAVRYHGDNKHLYSHSLECAQTEAEMFKVYNALTMQYNKMLKLNSKLIAIEQHNNNCKARAGNRPRQ